MKFLHLGDLHIGKLVNDFNMIDDQRFILDEILAMLKEHQADALLIAGDVYDKPVPSEEAVRLFDEFICHLATERIPTFIISGNHDSDERLNFGSTLFSSNNIFISSKFNGQMDKRTLEDEFGNINIYMLPFVKASQVRRFYPDEKIETYEDAVRTVIEHADLNKEERNVLIAHQFVAHRSADGKAEVQFGGSENLGVQNVGTIEVISHEIFDDFDYVALGHIHSAQYLGREEVRYSGSPLKYSLSEIDHKKSVPLVTLGRKSAISEIVAEEATETAAEEATETRSASCAEIELLPLVPKREMRHLKGELKHIIDPKHVTDTDDYIFVTLTDEDPLPNVINIIREYYPRLMKLNYENSHSKEISQVDFQNITRNKTFTEMISEFYLKMYGVEISEEELRIMKEVAREAGVDCEAD